MKTDETRQEDVEKTPFRMKYIVSVVLPLFFIAVFVFIVYAIDQSYPIAGDTVIRQLVGEMLHKEPNNLNTSDFRNITELDLSGQTIEDIRLLKKFTNLRELDISRLKVPVVRTPVWKTILIKVRVIKKTPPGIRTRGIVKTNLLNLRPLRNLSKLETLNLNFTPIESLAPLSGLKNLTELDIYGTPVFELEPLRRLPNLKTLNVGQTQITDLKPLRKLNNLHRLHIYNTKVTDIEPLRDLPNLTYLDIRNCTNILFNQVDDLQKSMPKLVIFDGREE